MNFDFSTKSERKFQEKYERERYRSHGRSQPFTVVHTLRSQLRSR